MKRRERRENGHHQNIKDKKYNKKFLKAIEVGSIKNQ